MSSSSSSGESKQLQLPNFYSGHLLARHVSRFSSYNPLPCCSLCGDAFKDEDEYMIDTYLQEGQTEVTMFDKQRTFDRTKVFMAHAKCMTAGCVKVIRESSSRVGFSLRGDETARDSDDVCDVVFEKFNWAIKWIQWHHLFLFGEETVSMTLGSMRPALTVGLCESFSLGMYKGSPKWQQVKFPVQLLSFSMLECMFTRIYEYDLEYVGPYQPIVQIESLVEKSLLNTQSGDPDVMICAHPVLNASYASRRANEQKVKLFVKARPPSVHIHALLQAFEERGSLTWHSLCRQLRQSNVVDTDSSSNEEEESESSDDLAHLHASFLILEGRIEAVFENAGVKVNLAKKTVVSEVKIQATKAQAEIAFRSNCYVETSKKLNRTYYFFKNDVKHESEQPLFCYEGVLGGVAPILVANVQQLSNEMNDAKLKLVEIPGLRVLLGHHRGELRVIKQA